MRKNSSLTKRCGLRRTGPFRVQSPRASQRLDLPEVLVRSDLTAILQEFFLTHKKGGGGAQKAESSLLLGSGERMDGTPKVRRYEASDRGNLTPSRPSSARITMARIIPWRISWTYAGPTPSEIEGRLLCMGCCYGGWSFEGPRPTWMATSAGSAASCSAVARGE